MLLLGEVLRTGDELMSEKNTGISICRVIATIMILLCHVIGYYSFIPGHQNLSQFFNVGVYIFIIISGYLYGMRKEKEISLSRFYKKRLQKIVTPVIIWELIVFWVDRDSGMTNLASVLLSVQGGKWISAKIPIADGGGMMAHTWFVTIILICYCMVPFLKKIPNVKKNCVHIITFALLSIAVLLSLLSLNIFYFIAFILSYYYAGSQYDVKRHKIVMIIAIMCVSILVRLSGKMLFDNSYFYSITIVNITQTILAFLFFILTKEVTESSQLMKKFGESQIVGWLDKNSYYIYIVHYGIIPFIYTNFSLPLASILFCLGTLLLAIVLSGIDKGILYLVSRLRRRRN